MNTDKTQEQIHQTFVRMVAEANYNPTEILEEESTTQYVDGWMKMEDEQNYAIGCPDWSARPALIFVVEAAANVCGMNYSTAIKLLQMGIAELEVLR